MLGIFFKYAWQEESNIMFKNFRKPLIAVCANCTATSCWGARLVLAFHEVPAILPNSPLDRGGAKLLAWYRCRRVIYLYFVYLHICKRYMMGSVYKMYGKRHCDQHPPTTTEEGVEMNPARDFHVASHQRPIATSVTGLQQHIEPLNVYFTARRLVFWGY